tara:strand:+ start:72 stop:434 length:363 start_codon:yes stop_codon:yes gene_type:complete
MAKGAKQVKPWAYSEGDLRARIKRYSESAEGSVVFGVSSITTKFSSSYAEHNHFAGDLVVEGALHVSGSYVPVFPSPISDSATIPNNRLCKYPGPLTIEVGASLSIGENSKVKVVAWEQF